MVEEEWRVYVRACVGEQECYCRSLLVIKL